MSAGCRHKAVQLLARRAHFRRELAAKLSARGYPDEEVEETLDRLTADGYLDDRATARDFAAARLARGPLGRRRLAYELQKKGADPELAFEVAAELVDEDDEPAAAAAAERWRARGGSDPAALARHLERKGFSGRAIRAVVRSSGS